MPRIVTAVTLRQTLIATGQPIETDLGSLKRDVTCPADAPASH